MEKEQALNEQESTLIKGSLHELINNDPLLKLSLTVHEPDSIDINPLLKYIGTTENPDPNRVYGAQYSAGFIQYPNGVIGELQVNVKFLTQDWMSDIDFAKSYNKYLKDAANKQPVTNKPNTVATKRPNAAESVVQDWVSRLSFMQQALLMTGMRGPDGSAKQNNVKPIVRFLRGAVLKPALNIEGNEDSFMWVDYREFYYYMETFFADTDTYPMHFLMHLIHCAEVLGYKYPAIYVRSYWQTFYSNACGAFRMTPETEGEMDARMNK